MENIRPIIEAIQISKIPMIELTWSTGSKTKWNVENYLKKNIKEPRSDYWKIINEETFSQVYLVNGFLKWDNIISQMHCCGDTSNQSVSFSSYEIAKDIGLNSSGNMYIL